MSTKKPNGKTQAQNSVASSAVLACAVALEKDMEREQREIDAHIAKEEYGHANYCKGRAHAFALASLRVKRLAQANDQAQRQRARDAALE